MKRILLFALPVLATLTVIGLGFFLLRPGLRGVRPQDGAVDTIVEEPVEVIE